MVLPTEATGYLNEPRFPWENCYCGAQRHLFSGVKRELLNTEVSFHGAGHQGVLVLQALVQRALSWVT